MTDPFALLAAALATVLGGGFLLVGLWYLNALRAVTFTRVTAPGRVQPGLTEVVARVQPTQDTLTAPLSGERCVGYVLREERAAGGLRSLLGRRWTRVAVASEFEPFAVGDGSGRVLVRPTPDGQGSWPGDAPDDFFTDLELSVDERAVFEAGDALPAGLGDQRTDAPRRYTEWRVGPGDVLYVLGRARAGETDDDPPVIENDDGPFIISESPQWRTALNRLLRGLVFAVVGGALLAYAAVAAGLL
ncbi:MAG: hypothetical protein ABEJ23_05250 [Haloarculaceae archaeon]